MLNVECLKYFKNSESKCYNEYLSTADKITASTWEWKALIGKDCNDMISVETPSGERNFEILKVDYI